jgi:hypothetical protein
MFDGWRRLIFPCSMFKHVMAWKGIDVDAKQKVNSPEVDIDNHYLCAQSGTNTHYTGLFKSGE